MLTVAGAGLAAGVALFLAGYDGGAHLSWALTTCAGLGAAAWWVWSAARRGRLGVDAIAVLALLGALVVGEYLAGAVITVMLATGRSLEASANARAHRELHALLARAPRVVHRYDAGGLTSPPLEDVIPGDLLLVEPGEVVPVDGEVAGGTAVLDESALTGEALPVEHPPGDRIRSGTANAGAPFDLRASSGAAESTYAGIVRLVAEAESSSAPIVRLADRYAAWFLAGSVTAATAAWIVSGELVRAVAVLVVATPCPLILAAPIAVTSGLSRAARRGVVIKGGSVLEQLARCRVLLFDKTGTLTSGRPTVHETISAGDVAPAELLRLAASLDQVSSHVLAIAVTAAARQQDLPLALPSGVEEIPGKGVVGRVEDHEVRVGKASWVGADPAVRWVRTVRRRADRDGALTIFIGMDGTAVGALVLDDPIRTDASRTIRDLRRAGITRIEMVTGDRADIAGTVGALLGVDEVRAEQSPADKVDSVRLARQQAPTIMVGDGINDAPALAAADVGVAMGVRGATASSEAADVVLVVDRLDRLAEAVCIARRTGRIARQSMVVGIGLSVGAMGAAAAGWLPPAWGALVQEGIDVAAIANALRALAGGANPTPRLGPEAAALSRRFSDEHRTLHPDLEVLRTAADAIDTADPPAALAEARAAYRFLTDDLVPHEQAEERDLYPLIDEVLGGNDPTGTMTRAHAEIIQLTRRLGRLLDDLDPTDPEEEDLFEVRRLLYGLHAILRLHFSQEDEGYFSLADHVTDQRSG